MPTHYEKCCILFLKTLSNAGQYHVETGIGFQTSLGESPHKRISLNMIVFKPLALGWICIYTKILVVAIIIDIII